MTNPGSGYTAMPTVTIKQGRAKPLWFGHPWVYSEAIASAEQSVALDPGDERTWNALADSCYQSWRPLTQPGDLPGPYDPRE